MSNKDQTPLVYCKALQGLVPIQAPLVPCSSLFTKPDDPSLFPSPQHSPAQEGLWPCHALCLEGFPVSLLLLTFPFSSQLLQVTFLMCWLGLFPLSGLSQDHPLPDLEHCQSCSFHLLE